MTRVSNETTDEDVARKLRWQVYALLILLAAGSVAGRIASVDSVDRIALQAHLRKNGRPEVTLQRPFLSANDRSRWCTIRALVEQGTYAIDDVVVQPGWDTIDMVKHDGHLYSSKPPLLSTLLAGPYWVLYHTTGWTLASHPYTIVRCTLFVGNLLPFIAYLWAVAWLAERGAGRDWSRVFVVAAAGFATFLSTFAVVLNNHLPAAVCAAATAVTLVRIWYQDDRRLGMFAAAGLASAMTAACELPALGLLAGSFLAAAWNSPRLTALGFIPAAVLVGAAFFGSNYAAHGSLRPPYAHRGPGDNWYDYTYQRQGKTVESYWRHPAGIDRGEPSVARYALHVLIGHHGVFSLTPVWLLVVVGLGMSLGRRGRWPAWIAAIGALSLVCLLFYIFRPLGDRNYGGLTSGFRWMFWLAPLWLCAMLPALDAAASRRWARGLCLALLAASALSAAFPTWNPWTHPWLYQMLPTDER